MRDRALGVVRLALFALGVIALQVLVFALGVHIIDGYMAEPTTTADVVGR